MTFTDNIANVLEVCKLKNLTVFKFIMDMCLVLRSQLLSQVQVELEDYMQMCIVRAPFLAAFKSGTVDEATIRVSVMGTVMAEWRVNRRVRQQTAKLQREIVKRQAEEQPVPCCSPAWIYQDFPSLLSETKADSLPISVLCDLILKRYDLTKDTEFRDLHYEVQSELQKQQPNYVSQAVQNDSQSIQNLPTTCAPKESTEQNSLPIRADWFRHYQPANPYIEVPLFGQTSRSTSVEASTHKHHKTANYPRQFNRHETKNHMPIFDSARRSSSIDSRTGLMAKKAGSCSRYNRPEVKTHNGQFGHSSCTNKTAPIRDSTVSSASRKYVRPRVNPYKQTQGHESTSNKSAELKPKINNKKKNFDQRIDEYLSRVCPNKTKTEHTETKSPEFSSAHMGGLVINIAKKPKSVQVTEPEQPKKELAVKERNRQAFLAHVARIQYKLKENMKADVQMDGNNSHRHVLQDPSVCNGVKTNHDKRDTSGAAFEPQKDTSRKRKALDAFISSDIQTKCARLDTGSDIKNHSRKRKAQETSLCTSVQNKYARLDTGSVVKALKCHVFKRKY